MGGCSNAKTPSSSRPDCIYHGFTLPAPRALRLLSQENLYEKDIPDEGWERDVFVFDWMVPSMHAKLQSTAGLQKREGERSSEQGTHLLLTG